MTSPEEADMRIRLAVHDLHRDQGSDIMTLKRLPFVPVLAAALATAALAIVLAHRHSPQPQPQAVSVPVPMSSAPSAECVQVTGAWDNMRSQMDGTTVSTASMMELDEALSFWYRADPAVGIVGADLHTAEGDMLDQDKFPADWAQMVSDYDIATASC